MVDQLLIRKAEELAVETMQESLSENSDKPHPNVGAVALFPDGEMICCHRGEFSDGEHAEYGLLERKCKDRDLSNAIIFTTLEPCHSRNKPKEPCCVRLKKRHVKTVYMGIDDPDPSVAGQGKKYMEDSGIEIHYFPRDLQMLISKANEVYLKDAIRRAENVPTKIEEKNAFNFLKQICINFDKTDISLSDLRTFARKANINQETDFIFESLSKIGLVMKGTNGFSFTNSFVLLFAKKPSKYLSNSIIKVKYRLADYEFDEPLVRLPSSFEKWLIEKMPFSTVRGLGGERSKKFAYPIEPIKEAFINALVHRDYSLEGSHIQIILDDKLLSIKSPGTVVDPQVLDDLSSFAAASIVRNHEINYIFKILSFVENNNLGMDKFKAVAFNDLLPSPLYTFKNPILSLTFYFAYSTLVDDVREKYQDDLSDNEIATLEIMKGHSPISSSDLLKALSLTNMKAAQRIFNELESRNLIFSRGHTKGTVYYLKK